MKITRDIGFVNETGSNLTVISYVVHICIHVQDELTIGIVIVVFLGFFVSMILTMIMDNNSKVSSILRYYYYDFRHFRES